MKFNEMIFSDLWLWPYWWLFHRKRIAYIPWEFGRYMRKILLLVAGLLALSQPASAQLEIGLGAGLYVEEVFNSKTTTLQVPADHIRIGYHGSTLAFETLVRMVHVRSGGQAGTLMEILPGIVYYLPRSYYVRGEVGTYLFSNSSGSRSQFAYGVATGIKKQVGPGPIYLRLETGIDWWQVNRDFFPSSTFRLLLDLSFVVT